MVLFLKPGSAYHVWANALTERVEKALAHADKDSSKGWVTGALKTTQTPFGEAITVGCNINYPTTNGHETYRIVAMTLDEDGSIVFVAHTSTAVANQCPSIYPTMFADSHRLIEAWY